MPDISITGIIAIIASAVSCIVLAVPVLNFVTGQIEARRKRLEEKNKSHLSLSADIAKIELERDEQERDELKEIVQLLKARCEECEKELKLSESTSLLSRTKKREINAMMLKINKNRYSLRKGFAEKYHVAELYAIFDHLDKEVDELENILP